MSAARPHLLPDPPPGIVFLRSPDEVLSNRSMDAYQHMLLRAWQAFDLSGVLVIRGIPTVYVREDDRELPPAEVATLDTLRRHKFIFCGPPISRLNKWPQFTVRPVF